VNAPLRWLELQTDWLDCIAAMRGAGLDVDAVEADGRIHRVKVEGDHAGQRSGWFIAHADGIPSCTFGSWRTGNRQVWRANPARECSPAERDRLRATWDQARRAREVERTREQHEAQRRASELWALGAPAHESHPYLLAKGIKPHGIYQCDDLLLIPARDTSRTLWNLQTIAPTGEKRFLPRARVRGLYCSIGGKVDDTLVITEGYATGATIYEATGLPVAIAFSANNLEPVARALRETHASARIVIAADNDEETERRLGTNPGRHYAERAARVVGGFVCWPEFPA
jgi:putative DNA primase/helicase